MDTEQVIRLSPEQIETYHRDGYLIVEDLLTSTDVAPSPIARLRRSAQGAIVTSRSWRPSPTDETNISVPDTTREHADEFWIENASHSARVLDVDEEVGTIEGGKPCRAETWRFPPPRSQARGR